MVKLTMSTSTEVHGDKVRLKRPLDDTCEVPLGKETVVHLKQNACCSRSCTGVVIAVFIILAISGTVTGVYLKYHMHPRRQCIDWGPGCDTKEPPKFEGHHGKNDVDPGSHSGESGSDSGSKSGEGGSENGDSDRKSGERWMKESGGSDESGDKDSKSGESEIKNGENGTSQSGERGSANGERNPGVFPLGESGDHVGHNNGRHLGRHKGHIDKDWTSPRRDGPERHHDRDRNHPREDRIEPRYRPKYRKYPPGPAGPQDDSDGQARPRHHLPLP